MSEAKCRISLGTEPCLSARGRKGAQVHPAGEAQHILCSMQCLLGTLELRSGFGEGRTQMQIKPNPWMGYGLAGRVMGVKLQGEQRVALCLCTVCTVCTLVHNGVSHEPAWSFQTWLCSWCVSRA